MSETHQAPATPEPPAPIPEPVIPTPDPPIPVEPPAPAPEPPPAEVPEPAAAREPQAGFLTEPPKPDEAAKPTEEPAAPPEPAPVEEPPRYEFTLPDGVTLDPERVGPLTQWLGEHKIPAEKAQQLLDMHLGAMQALAEHTVNEQWRAFEESRITKRNEAMADPSFGGAGFRTNANAGQRAIDLFMPDQTERAELYRRLDASGMSDDLYLGKLLVNIARRFAEPALPPPNPAPRAPREAAGRAPRGQGRASLYQYPRGGNRSSG